MIQNYHNNKIRIIVRLTKLRSTTNWTISRTTARLENVSKKVFFYVVYIYDGFIHHDKFLYLIGMWISIIILVKSNLVIPSKT